MKHERPSLGRKLSLAVTTFALWAGVPLVQGTVEGYTAANDKKDSASEKAVAKNIAAQRSDTSRIAIATIAKPKSKLKTDADSKALHGKKF